MVAGTGTHELPRDETRLAREVGRRLAGEGFGLITCGWPGVDAVVAQAFADHLATEDRPRFLKQFVYPRPTARTVLRDIVDGGLLRKLASTALRDPAYLSAALRRSPDILGGQLIEVRSEIEEYQSVEHADAVVLIGGMSGTRRVAELAEQLGKPVLPLSTSTGASRACYQRLLASVCAARPGRFSVAQLQGLIGGRDTVVANLMRLLHFVLGPTEGRDGPPVHLYVSHVAADEKACQTLLTHLRPLQRQGRIVPSRRREIDPGSTLTTAVQHHLIRAEIIVLLISAAYFACDTCWNEELGPALERHRARASVVLPVLLSPVLDLSPLDGLVPANTRPLLDGPHTEARWQRVAQQVAQTAAARSVGPPAASA